MNYGIRLHPTQRDGECNSVQWYKVAKVAESEFRNWSVYRNDDFLTYTFQNTDSFHCFLGISI